MKARTAILFAIVFAALSVNSCVPGKKHKALSDSGRQFMNERDAFREENIGLQMNNKELESKVATLERETGELKKDYEKVRGERDKVLGDYRSITSRYSELQNAQDDLIRGNVRETQKLLAELKEAQANLQRKEDLLKQLSESLDSKKASLDELTFELEKRNARLAEMEKILDAQKKIVQDLKAKVSEALLGFENKGLTVAIKNGMVYISLDEKLLFRSGSYEIDANGRSAIKKLAAVLEMNPGIQITIEGHTDNVPYNSGSPLLKDNWDLSVKRATTVVRVLTEGTKIAPKRLTASGRSEFLPVDVTNTPDARQKNRRTEIILTPDLTELYDLINKY